MILDYPSIGERELFYIYILRYHQYCGKRFLKESFEDFYVYKENMNNVLFPKKIEACLKDLHMSPKDYIEKHSVLPYYRLFLPKERYNQAIEFMLHTTQSYTVKLYMNSEVKKIQHSIYYCPICHRIARDSYEDIKIFHQIPKVLVCPRHRCYLNCVDTKPVRKLTEPALWDSGVKKCENELFFGIAADVSYILGTRLDMALKDLKNELRKKLMLREVYSECGGWKREFEESCIRKYCKALREYQGLCCVYSLNKFISDIDFPINPIEYLLFIRVVFGSFQKFIEKR